jgi:hypothetical protein
MKRLTSLTTLDVLPERNYIVRLRTQGQMEKKQMQWNSKYHINDLTALPWKRNRLLVGRSHVVAERGTIMNLVRSVKNISKKNRRFVFGPQNAGVTTFREILV